MHVASDNQLTDGDQDIQVCTSVVDHFIFHYKNPGCGSFGCPILQLTVSP